jgi:8-oxo-dGTP pyrophosphatase MutT (NUDIX family)
MMASGALMAGSATLADEVVTAGAYVLVGGRFVFMVGFPLPARDRLGVVRLGGHREPGEPTWPCAAREVAEESGLTAHPLPPPATFWVGPGQDAAALTSGPWPAEAEEPVPPLLVGWRLEGGRRRLSATYLVRGEGTPIPLGETQGLLLLHPDEVRRLARERLSLGTFLRDGGQALLRTPLPTHLPLEPRLQLSALAVLLDRYPNRLAAESDPARDS